MGRAPVLDCHKVQCVTLLTSLQRNNGSVTKVPRRCPGEPKCRFREGMEESYETFEEELWPQRAEPPPQKPVRQIRRPDMYPTRKIREEAATVPQQPRAEPKILPREPSIPRTASLHKTSSIQNLTDIEKPWENVTLNRCLFVAITILVLTSGLQRLNETLRGSPGTVEEEEEEVGLTMRRSGALRHRGQPSEPETSLWEVLFWWLPDLDDEDDEDEEDDNDGGVKKAKSKRGAESSSRLRNKPLPDKKLMKRRDGKLKDRRAKKARDEEVKDKKERAKKEDPEEEEADEDVDEDEGEEDSVPKKSKKPEGKKDKKKTQKG